MTTRFVVDQMPGGTSFVGLAAAIFEVVAGGGGAATCEVGCWIRVLITGRVGRDGCICRSCQFAARSMAQERRPGFRTIERLKDQDGSGT